MTFLVRKAIDTGAAIAGVASPEYGATAVFLGIVRDHDNGKAVDRLEYEAHEPMAEVQVGHLVERAMTRWDVGRVSVQHRLGDLSIGEVSVIVAVSAVHREPALEACRWLIDTLKAEVPIFKKEWYADGSAWVGDEVGG
ncbi:MAG: molybdopterin synthase catalytic subunit [Candidatus Dormibacteria bacterium]